MRELPNTWLLLTFQIGSLGGFGSESKDLGRSETLLSKNIVVYVRSFRKVPGSES